MVDHQPDDLSKAKCCGINFEELVLPADEETAQQATEVKENSDEGFYRSGGSCIINIEDSFEYQNRLIYSDVIDDSSTPHSEENLDQPQQSKETSGLDAEYMKANDNLRRFESMKRFHPGILISPDLRPSCNFHTIAFEIKNSYTPGEHLEPYPAQFQSTWGDENYIPMPCCRQNTRKLKYKLSHSSNTNKDENLPNSFDDKKVPEDDESSQSNQSWEERTIHFWERINSSLSKHLSSCQDIANSMRYYWKSRSDLNGLDFALNEIMSSDERKNFFDHILPFMQRLCLDLPNCVTCPVPVLRQFFNHSISFSQRQVACLLANAFFSTFPKRFGDVSAFSEINLNELFIGDRDGSKVKMNLMGQKIRCIIHYFERIYQDMPVGVVTYTRRSLKNCSVPDWQHSKEKLATLVPLLSGTIEDDGSGLSKVDFANRFVGGGVLGKGAVQEEILFVIYPELLLAKLFTVKLTSREALIVTGCERFSKYSGYADSFEYAGNYIDCSPFDARLRRCNQIIAIDALPGSHAESQFSYENILREANKAFIGFSTWGDSCNIGIASGKWGCGAFKGNAQLKTMIQLLAASAARRDLAVFTFGDTQLVKDLDGITEVVKDLTVGQVWNSMVEYDEEINSEMKSYVSLFEFMKSKLASENEECSTR